MQVREGMSETVLTIGPRHTLRDAAQAMCRRNVGAAVVLDPEAPGPGVITERDILRAVGSGEDPERELVADHLTADLTFASPDWSLEQPRPRSWSGAASATWSWSTAASSPAILSMRDIVRCWTRRRRD